MTKPGGETNQPTARCRHCRRVFVIQRVGRPRLFCSQACRQSAWVSRRRAGRAQLDDGEVIITTAELDGLHDELFVLACAVDDAERDIADAGPKATSRALREILDGLLDGARPIRDRELGVRTERP